ncbi:VQ motif-containing protein 22-like [Cynara cardunculus var. scolymus]|uniref:VQ motif-containing protein 22-like n=1 Tax=Cynara cardunculus var. scolymus TaxID=59895 RepID=UPI000D625EAB|nr:VQ motif-containing protein 22-like [Cynara cardunculus var. scolymus]
MATSNNEWLQIYQNNLTGTAQPTVVRWSGDVITEATTVTTASTASSHLTRVTRPINPRRRSRASRRTPVTLLNTDTTNFRAMVQQFTGIGGGGGGGGSTSFPAVPTTVSPSQSLTSYNTNSSGFNHYSAAAGGYDLEFRQSLPQQQRYYTMAAENGGAASDGDNQHGFFQRLLEEGMGGSNKAANFY